MLMLGFLGFSGDLRSFDGFGRVEDAGGDGDVGDAPDGRSELECLSGQPHISQERGPGIDFEKVLA
jgi:hypothetical protein